MTVTPNKKSGKGMIHQQVSELSTFFTVKPGHEAEMRAACERFQAKLVEMGADVHLKMGLRHWRFVLFDGDKRLLLTTTFESDWDPYIDDAVTVLSVDMFIDWLQHTVERDALGSSATDVIADLRRGIPNTRVIKALLQSAQVPAVAFFDVLSDQTVPQIRKAQALEKTFERLLDDPAAVQALQQPSLQPLLDQAST